MKWLLSVILLFLVQSCKFNSQELKICKFSFGKDEISVHVKRKFAAEDLRLNYSISCGDIILYSENVLLDFNTKGDFILHFPTLKHEHFIEDKIDSLAYWVTKKECLDVHYKIIKDTTVLVDSVKFYNFNEHVKNLTDTIYAELLSDKYGKVKYEDFSQYIKRAKTFLVEHYIRERESFVETMARNIYNILNWEKDIKECVLEDVNVVTKLPQVSLNVLTNLNSQNFYLIAVKNEDELKAFTKEEIVNDFKKSTIYTQKGKKQMTLPLLKSDEFSDGLHYIFLLGIDENWNYDYNLVGGVVLDKYGPFFYRESSIKSPHYIFPKRSQHFSTKKEFFYYKHIHVTCEYYHVNSSIRSITWGNFEGNNYFGYPITLSVNFEDIGDIDYLIIQGKKYKISWSDITDKLGPNPRFIFEHRFPQLNIGDNYINIKFVDKLGNISTGRINIVTERIRNEGIEINNSIFNDVD